MRHRWPVVLFALVAACGGSVTSTADTASEVTSATTAVTGASPTSSSGDETTSTVASRPEVDACMLVDADDAMSVLGSEATRDSSPVDDFGQASTCVWVTASEAMLVVTLFDGAEFYGGVLPGGDSIDVGDEGFIVVEPSFGGVTLQFRQGEWVVDLSAVPSGVVDVEGLPDAMKEVAGRAAGRLP